MVFFSPQLCWHCQEVLRKNERRFCFSCWKFFSFIPLEGRCSSCGRDVERRTWVCDVCREKPRLMKQFYSCVDYVGPVITLLQMFLSGKAPFIAEDLSAFLVKRILEEGGEAGLHYVIPLPLPFWEKFWKGWNPVLSVASEVAKILQLPIIMPLHCSIGCEKEEGDPSCVIFKKKISVREVHWWEEKQDICSLYGTRVLLLDLLSVGGAPQFCEAAEALDIFHLESVLGLSFAYNGQREA